VANPCCRVDAALIDALHARDFCIGVETTAPSSRRKAWTGSASSPKAGADLRIRQGHELKLIYPQPDASPESFADLAFERFSLQPMDGA